MEQIGSHWTDFHEIWYLKIFSKIYKIRVSLKSDKNNGYFTMKTDTNFLPYFAHFFLEFEIFRTNVAKKIKTRILYSVKFFFSKFLQSMR